MIALILICIVTLINKTSCQQPTYYRLTPTHGTNVGRSVNNFTCPGNGAITNIKYYLDKYIMSLEFVCSSATGITSFGPYGSSTGTPDAFNCPKGQYVSSVYGNAGRYLSRLGVRCRTVTEDLKGNGTDLKKLVQGSTSDEFEVFDDFAYGNGARPVGMSIWTSIEVEAIQLTYANSPVKLCTGINCTNYQEQSTICYGSNTTSDYRLSVFRCPRGGAVTLIKTKINGGIIGSLQFGCSSGVGIMMTEVFGKPFGNSTDRVTAIECPPGMIVGSIHGYYGYYINGIGIRCVVYGTTGDSPKYDVLGQAAGVAFDDAEYSNKGWRPVQFRVYHGDSGVYGIQVKYGNANVATNCRVTNIQVVDTSFQAESDGFEVIGIATELSCTNRTQVLKLDYNSVKADEVSFEVSNGNDTHWAGEVTISGTVGFEVLGVTGSITASRSASYGESDHFSSSNTNATSTSALQYAGTEITYQAPGACIIVGFVNRYKFQRNNVDVRYNYKCDTGEMAYDLAKINLQAKTYGNAHFDNYQMRLNGTASCTDDVRGCLKTLNANQLVSNPTGLIEAFTACFKNVTGEIH